jgi:peptide chain release factor 1
MLQSRLLAFEKERHAAEIGKQRKEMVGQGMRSEKIRTYNFPQNRVTDHQADITLKNLDYVIEGNLDEIIDTLCSQDREKRRRLALQG